MSSDALLERTQLFKGRVVDLGLDRVRLPNGSESVMETVRHPGAGAVLAVEEASSSDPTLVLIRQYRYVTGGDLLEVPAGLPREGEGFEACAARELEEETGLRAERLDFLTRFYTTPGFTDEVVHLFLATGLSAVTAERDPDELIEIARTPLSAALAYVLDGTIRDAKTIAAVLLFARIRESE